MRIDKLTTKFQEALAEAQTLALTHDNAFIEPVHVLAAMIRTDDAPKALMKLPCKDYHGVPLRIGILKRLQCQ
jgi:ATP-dependent Clp protease ATP-binding subunit ClpA